MPPRNRAGGSTRDGSVAVGTRISSRAPRTDPYVRFSRIRLPPRVRDGKAIAWPRVEDDRFWEPGVHQLGHPCPGDPILVAATPQRAPPEVSDMVPEHVQCARVGRHCVIVEVAADDPPQPLPLFGDRLVRESRTYGSGAARLAAIPAGASPANTRSPVHVVVIPSGREGDQTAGSLEVKALWGRGDLVRSVKGGRATWQAVA